MDDALDRVQHDLLSSGLTIADMGIRTLDNSIRAATNTPYHAQGYVIPYLNIQEVLQPFYRVKIFDGDPKYRQPTGKPNHVYFPRDFLKVARTQPYVLLTEGEKKAAIATKRGFPCVALGGVDSWRNRIVTLPGEVELNKESEKLRAKLPAGTELQEDFLSPLALGMQDLIDFILQNDKHLVIVYDTDTKQETTHNVQRAAASLGYELRFRGIPYTNIRQLRLPLLNAGDDPTKTALDDYLVHAGSDNFQELLSSVLKKRSAFPRHPNVRDYINKRLQKAKMSRKEHQQVSMAILSELDAGGIRLKDMQQLQTYYFDNKTHRLLKAEFGGAPNELTDSAFGQYLYRTFGIGAADQRLIQWLGTQFTGEDPIEEVSPYRVIARRDTSKDSVILQISDGAYVEVSANIEEKSATPGLTFHDNGTNNILFESEQVKPLDPKRLAEEYAKQYRQSLRPWWAEVLDGTRIVDKNQGKILTALLYYVAPWLLRWRGTQLPVEMTLGEAGSGKSTLQELRLEILNGLPMLRNAPQDYKDWTASVTSTGGLHVIDNLQLPDRNLRQRLSDEICRIVTEPNPTIEQRKYYTNADLMRLPVRCQFGITAIKQPFLNQDVLARAIIVELDKAQDMVNGQISYDMTWKDNQLARFGGREAWVAHHLLVLHRFFELVRQKWNYKYPAKHRLINLEQCLVLMGEVFGIKNAQEWIPAYLVKTNNSAVLDTDWAFQGIMEFCQFQRAQGKAGNHVSVVEISAWAEMNEEFEKCEELTNTRRLGRYLVTHKAFIASACGLVEAGKSNNRMRYLLEKR